MVRGSEREEWSRGEDIFIVQSHKRAICLIELAIKRDCIAPHLPLTPRPSEQHVLIKRLPRRNVPLNWLRETHCSRLCSPFVTRGDAGLQLSSWAGSHDQVHDNTRARVVHVICKGRTRRCCPSGCHSPCADSPRCAESRSTDTDGVARSCLRLGSVRAPSWE